MNIFDWEKIKENQNEKQFYYEDKPVFKKYLSLLKFHEPGLAPVQDETGWYHILQNGKPLYSQRYNRAFGYYCGRAAVTSIKGCLHIDTEGNEVYSMRYSWCGNYQENYCTVRNGKEYFHIGLKGVPLYEDKYLYAGDFRDGIACVKCEDNLWRHIQSDGTFLNGKSFYDLGVFHKNIAPARDKEGFFHSNLKGEPLYKQRYMIIEDFYNGFALVTDFDCSKKIINEKGEEILCL